jgi:transposase-like protein
MQRNLGTETGMMGPGGGETMVVNKKRAGDKSAPVCKHCGSDTHSRQAKSAKQKHRSGQGETRRSVTIRNAM